MLLFGLLPFMFVLFMRSRRSRKLSEQLPEALEMMARSLRAGHALSSAFKMVATEMPTPVSIEFGRAFEAQELGLPFEKAVADMTRRAPDNQDLKIFALSVIVQKETGGNLVEIIEKIAETVRGSVQVPGQAGGPHRRRANVQLHRGRVAVRDVAVLAVVNRPYVMPLFTTDARPLLPRLRRAVSWTLGFSCDEEHDEDDDLMLDAASRHSYELLVAVVGGLICSWRWLSVPDTCWATSRDEVMERLERPRAGMDLSPSTGRPRSPWRGIARSCARSPGW